jgi:hypothetical protein
MKRGKATRTRLAVGVFWITLGIACTLLLAISFAVEAVIQRRDLD